MGGQSALKVIVGETLRNLPSFIVLLLILALVIGIRMELNKTDVYDALRNELTGNPEFKDYVKENPRITYITAEILTASQQTPFFRDAKIGQWLLEYPSGFSAIYDSKTDSVVNKVKVETGPGDLLTKFMANEEYSAYAGIQPQVIKILPENLASLQGQISGLNEQNIGQYILSYPDRVIIYDYGNDTVVLDAPLQQALPQDFSQKLMAHNEIKPFAAQNPQIAIIDDALAQQIRTLDPTIGDAASVGLYALQYPTHLVIYDYATDTITAVIALQNGN